MGTFLITAAAAIAAAAGVTLLLYWAAPAYLMGAWIVWGRMTHRKHW